MKAGLGVRDPGSGTRSLEVEPRVPDPGSRIPDPGLRLSRCYPSPESAESLRVPMLVLNLRPDTPSRDPHDHHADDILDVAVIGAGG